MQGSEKMEIRTTNALINEKSPYLLRRTFPTTIKTTIQTKLLKAQLHSEVFEKQSYVYWLRYNSL